MLAVPVYNMDGKQSGEVQVDPDVLGGRVRPQLIKQAIVAYLNHRRQDSARTQGRSQVEGSSRKLYRQKGTGNARVGNIRTPIRRGGGRTFAKRGPRAVKSLPKKMRRLARNSAILAKIQANEALVVDDVRCDQPKTKSVVAMFSALGIQRGCLLALHEHDRNVYLSTRNVPDADVCLLNDLNAYDVLRRRKLLFTRPAFERLMADPMTFRESATEA
ncbi:MAG: 50S ribosomal protein L4 [Phycisphaerae bacterium]|jgi:large subunit ribosomal protein L4